MSISNRPTGAAVGLEQFKRAQRQVWEEGDYQPVGRLPESAAHMLVDRAAVIAGQRVLDVATGSGTVAVAAAQAGGNVLGIDITGAWFADARGLGSRPAWTSSSKSATPRICRWRTRRSMWCCRALGSSSPSARGRRG